MDYFKIIFYVKNKINKDATIMSSATPIIKYVIINNQTHLKSRWLVEISKRSSASLESLCVFKD